MNKEREALLKEILAQPDVPHKVSERSIQRLLGRMKPQTEEMRDYLIAYYSAETRAESRAFSNAFYAKLSPQEAKDFDEAYCQCLLNDVGLTEPVEMEALAQAA
jgi:hypothetical protein